MFLSLGGVMFLRSTHSGGVLVELLLGSYVVLYLHHATKLKLYLKKKAAIYVWSIDCFFSVVNPSSTPQSVRFRCGLLWERLESLIRIIINDLNCQHSRRQHKRTDKENSILLCTRTNSLSPKKRPPEKSKQAALLSSLAAVTVILVFSSTASECSEQNHIRI